MPRRDGHVVAGSLCWGAGESVEEAEGFCGRGARGLGLEEVGEEGPYRFTGFPEKTVQLFKARTSESLRGVKSGTGRL